MDVIPIIAQEFLGVLGVRLHYHPSYTKILPQKIYATTSVRMFVFSR